MKKILYILILLITGNILYAFQLNIDKYTITDKNYININGTSSDNYVKIAGSFVSVNNGKFDLNVPINNGINIIPIVARTEKGKILKSYFYVKKKTKVTDIPEKYWSFPIINDLVDNNIIDLYPGNTFRPTENITQGDLIAWVVRVKGLNILPLKKDISKYLPKNYWLSPYVKAAFDNGLIKGNINNYDPEIYINRKDAFVFILNNFEVIDLNSKNKGINLGKEYKLKYPQIYNAIEKGVITGASSKMDFIDLNRPAYRDEVAKVLYYTKNVQKIVNMETPKVVTNYSDIIILNNGPKILDIRIFPVNIILNDEIKEEYLNVYVKVYDNDGVRDIESVMLDTRSVSKENTMLRMMDTGDWGDENPHDNWYSCQVLIKDPAYSRINMPLYVTDYSGLQARSIVPVTITQPETNVSIKDIKIKIDGRHLKLSLKAENNMFIKTISVDLKELNAKELYSMRQMPGNMYGFDYFIPTNVEKGVRNIYITVVTNNNKKMKYRIRIKAN